MTFITPPGRGKPAQPAAASHSSPFVIDVDERSFQKEVLDRSQDKPVVIDFWAPWCGPCRALGPVLEKLAGEAKGSWVLAKVNVDENPRLSQMFGVQGIPAVKAVHKGKLVSEFTGAQPEPQVRAWLKRFVPESAGATEAQLTVDETSDPQAAIAQYRQLLAKDAKNAEARLGLGRLLAGLGDTEAVSVLREIEPGSALFGQAQAWQTLAELIAEHKQADAADLSAQVEADTNNYEAHYALAAQAIATQHYEDAIERLMAIVMRNRGFRDDGARKALVALFNALGEQHALVGPARKRLANMLF